MDDGQVLCNRNPLADSIVTDSGQTCLIFSYISLGRPEGELGQLEHHAPLSKDISRWDSPGQMAVMRPRKSTEQAAR